MSFKEPCYCGSPDCPRCYPLTWDNLSPEFCDECSYIHTCGSYGDPSKQCEKYLDLTEPND